MAFVGKNGNGSIDIVFQVRGYHLAQPNTLAAHIAALGNTGVEKAEFTTIGIGLATYVITVVTLSCGIKQFGLGGNIVATENVVDSFVTVGWVIEFRLEDLSYDGGVHVFECLMNVSERMMSAVVSATCLVAVGVLGWL